ncbi:MAG: AarF/ABC1/UbiB kinase family protein [Rhodobacteraceae bacterium]|nr:AarF/ABC1/UbiB kinase family protein [Paracoccaceae bacterium]
MSQAPKQRGLAIPTGRLNRMIRFSGMTAAVAGNMAVNGGVELLSGTRPKLRDLLLTPSNAARVADHLARMRGAAMKAGQLLSMETQDLLPAEISQILGRLRAEAHVMPPSQLKRVLIANWGQTFLKQFESFNVHPIAAASIGQVHRARTADGRDVVVKVQYPGIRDSIDSDMRNLGALLRASNMVPDEFDLNRLMEDARKQLHEETDYRREAEALRRFGRHLENRDGFVVPSVQDDLSTDDILTMTFLNGLPIENVATMDQSTRDSVAERVLTLMLYEVFVLRDVQTDANFANYRYDPIEDRVILLDFGATRQFDATLTAACLRMLKTMVTGARGEVIDQLVEIGLIGPDLSSADRAELLKLFDIASEPFRQGGVFEFGNSDLLPRLRYAGFDLAKAQVAMHAPPTDVLFLQRKVLGCYLLAERLGARVDLDQLLRPYL